MRLIIVGIVLLGIGLCVQLIPKRIEQRFPPSGPLAGLIPKEYPGWAVQDAPLGDTELVKEKVATILKYDDYVFRVYRQGTVEIGVFVAYWKPGTSDIIEVGSHSPDLCWPQNGWARQGPELEATFRLEGRASETAQVRTFTKDGVVQHTAFWHLMGGKRTGYAQGDQTKWGKRAPAVLQNLLNTKLGFVQTEQYFIRITSTHPVSALQHETIFNELLRSIAQFGVFPQP